MKNIRASLGPVASIIFMLSIIEAIMAVIFVLLSSSDTCPVNAQIFETILSSLIQITLGASLLFGLGYISAGIFGIILPKKNENKNNFKGKMILRGGILILTIILFYIILYSMSNIFGITLCRSILPQL